MALAHEERKPLLAGAAPFNPNTSSLNPRAASFQFQPRTQSSSAIARPSTPPTQPVEPVQAATIVNGKHEQTSLDQMLPLSQQSTAEQANAAVNPVSGDETPTAATDEQDLTTAFSAPQSPLRTTVVRAASIHSTRSSESSVSSISFVLLPLRQAFLRAQLLQFFFSALIFLAFAIGVTAWKHEVRWWEFALGFVAWLSAEGLKEIVFDALSREVVAVSPPTAEERRRLPGRGLSVPTVVHAVVQEGLRLGAVVCLVALLPDTDTPSIGGPVVSAPIILLPPPPSRHQHPEPPVEPLPPLDTLFWSACWMALGWALAEIAFASREWWTYVKLYKDLLIDENEQLGDEEIAQSARKRRGLGDERPTKTYGAVDSDTHKFVSQVNGTRDAPEQDSGHDNNNEDEAFDEAVEARIREIERDEVEMQLGVPLYEIPAAVVIVWRLDSILLSLVLTLVMSLPFRTSAPSLVAFPLWPTFAVVAATHALISLLWLLRIRFAGIAAISYTTLVILVFLTFAALAAWGALI
ncbi:hypothetical protein OIV83_001210 [Microbotryomycetes sp. JL201]|nr:hypothetical protein OIV83_001210 [Microbotryomycetes sp. JL201]